MRRTDSLRLVDLSRPRPDSAREIVTAYKRSLIWSRATLVLFFLFYVTTLAYTIPWLPYGLDVEDYDSKTSGLVVLLLSASITAFGSVYLRESRKRLEQTFRTWETMHEGLGEMRGREYFYDRIVIECERASSDRTQFTVTVLRITDEAAFGERYMRDALKELSSAIGESDCLSTISPREIGVLAPSLSSAGAAAFSTRLAAIAASVLPNDGAIRVGHVVYGVDAKDAAELVAIARTRLQPWVPVDALIEHAAA